jgi:threonine/homoserine efflux transporter RhtA
MLSVLPFFLFTLQQNGAVCVHEVDCIVIANIAVAPFLFELCAREFTEPEIVILPTEVSWAISSVLSFYWAVIVLRHKAESRSKYVAIV